MNKLFYLILLLFCCSYTVMKGQISFTDQTNLSGVKDNFSGVAMGVLDINGDGLDDILKLNQGIELNVEFQSGNGFTNMEFGNVALSSQWSMCAGDVNNDGVSEVLSGGISSIYLARFDLGAGTFVNEELEYTGSIFVQGTNFADINNDGFLDMFSCHDNGESFIWGNDGEGNFTQVDWIDMSENGDSGEAASGNYGSVWTDIDNDGDIDLYIAKCRQGVTNVNDPRRINQLYINDGSGNFSEQASAFGLASGWQSWTADFGDVNNDGWQDCFITNHDHNAELLINDGSGNFTEKINSGIEINGTPIQGIFRDFDNDGFLDILVAGSRSQFFRNNGDETFTEINNLFDDNDMESFGLGDLNSDGYVDIYGGYANIYTSPSNINDKVWINDGGSNNYSAVTLQGVSSNRDAVGARVELYGEWGKQIREVRAGESYGISNSRTCYFGLGTATSIDSVVIMWPSGLRQIESDISINSKVTILEGGCLAQAPEIVVDGEVLFCSGDSLILSVPEGFNSYEWSNGSTETTIIIKESGNYSLKITNGEGCTGFSKIINVIVDPMQIPEILVVDDQFDVCYGTPVVLQQKGNVGDANLIWSNGSDEPSIEVTESGSYTVTAKGLCEDFISDQVVINIYEELEAPEATGANIQPGENATLTAVGTRLAWYDSETSTDVLEEGETFIVSGLTETTQYYVADRSGNGFKGYVGKIDHTGSEYPPNPDENNGVRFTALQDFTLDSVTVYTDQAGTRRIVLYEGFFNELEGVFVDIPEGESTIYLGLEIKAGAEYRLSTDFFENINIAGNFGPRLRRSIEGVNYPYVLDEVVELTGSDFNQDWYYYFYDWQVSTGVSCDGKRTEVEVVVEPLSTGDPEYSEISIYPNPLDDNFHIYMPSDVELPISIEIYDISGRKAMSKMINQRDHKIDTQSLQTGIYRVKIISKKNIYQSKIVKR